MQISSYKDPAEFKGTRLVHTLNGSGLAVGRTMAAIMEGIRMQMAPLPYLRRYVPYMGGIEVILRIVSLLTKTDSILEMVFYRIVETIFFINIINMCSVNQLY